MTINPGDTPDWQTLTSPNYQAVSALGVGGSTTFDIVSGANDFRIWQVWLAASAGLSAVSAAAFAGLSAVMQDGAGNVLASVVPFVENNGQSASLVVVYPTYGIKAAIHLGLYKLQIVTGAVIGGADIEVQGGAIISFP